MMPDSLPLEYARPTGQPGALRVQRLLRGAWKALVWMSLFLFAATIVLWVRSYWVRATVPPAWPHIPTFEPSDALELLVPYAGRFEHWEYTDWDNRWYRTGPGIPIWFVAGMFLILPTVSFLRARGRPAMIK